MTRKQKLITEMLDKKADENNTICLNAYATGLSKMYDELASDTDSIDLVSGTTTTDCGKDGVKTTCNQCGSVIKEVKPYR